MKIRNTLLTAAAELLSLPHLGCPPKLAGAPAAGGGGAAAKGGLVDDSAARKERILANLEHDIPELVSLNPQLGQFERIEGGVDIVTMTLQTPIGPKEQILLVTPDDKRLFMSLGEPLDVSRTAEDLRSEADRARAEMMAALEALVQGRPSRGSAQAPVTVVEFSEFQCPFCRRAYATVEQLLQKHGDQVRFFFVHFPLSFHDWARPAAVAAECAVQQKEEAFWVLYERFFQKQDQITADNVMAQAKAFLADSGIDLGKWEACATLDSGPGHQQAMAALERGMRTGAELGLDGVPAFFINGERMSGAVPLEEIEEAITKAQVSAGAKGPTAAAPVAAPGPAALEPEAVAPPAPAPAASAPAAHAPAAPAP